MPDLSQAMYHLNVSTTRALSLVVSREERVMRPWYSGHDQGPPLCAPYRATPQGTWYGCIHTSMQDTWYGCDSWWQGSGTEEM